MFNKEIQSCGECHYCDLTNTSSGRCRRQPPTVIAFPVQGPSASAGGVISSFGQGISLKQFSFYPPVNPDDIGCGRFLRRKPEGALDE